jgi:hypothetical protein
VTDCATEFAPMQQIAREAVLSAVWQREYLHPIE